MKIIKAIFLLCCLLAVGDNRVNAGGFDLLHLMDCSSIVLEGGSYVIERAVPLIRDLAKCTDFKTDSNADLDYNGFLRVVNQFLKNLIFNINCLLKSMDTVNTYIEPFVKKFKRRQCLPKF